MTLYEVDEAATRIRDDVDPEANIIFGSTFDEKLNGTMRVSVVATGIGALHQLNTFKSDNLIPTKNAGITEEEDMSSTLQSVFSMGQAPISNFSDKHEKTAVFSDMSSDMNVPEENKAQIMPSADEEENKISPDVTEVQLQSKVQEMPINNIDEVLPKVEEVPSAPEATVKKKKTSSLFERFTGVARKLNASPAEKEEPKKEESMEQDQDLLDIPAFLRRGQK